MEELLNLIKSGECLTIDCLADKLHTTKADILRQTEYLEHIGIIRQVNSSLSGCSGGSCSCNSRCSSCVSHNVSVKTGIAWEIVR